MILTKEVEIFISNKIISYYKNLGYNIIPNGINKIKVKDLLRNSRIRVDVKCDICGKEKDITYQKYNKNILKYEVYTCSTTCSQFKIKKTNLEKYGDENYVNVELQRKLTKERYDKILEKEISNGYINCIICKINNPLSDYIFKNNRYRKKCLKCRTKTSIKNRELRFKLNPDLEKEKEKVRGKKYSENNREKINKRASIYYHNILKRTKKYKYVWRGILKSYLKRINRNKTNSTYSMIGYSDVELKLHIESLFINKMSWDNYNILWQVDHIIPVSLFKDDTPPEVVNSLRNLRPLDKYINLSRGKTIDNIDILYEFINYVDLSKLKGII